MKKLVFIIIISFFLFNPFDALAITVTPIMTSTYDTGVTWREYGPGSVSGAYTDHIKVIPLNGKQYPAFCVDPGLKLNAGQIYECEPTTDAGLIYLMNQYNAGVDYSTVQLAYRFYASYVGIGSSELTEMKAAIIRFRQVKEGTADAMQEACASVGLNCSINPYDYLEGNSAWVETAYAMSRDAYIARSNGAGAGGGSTNVFFTKTVDTPESITYTLSSASPINEMEFECENCTIVSSSWAGTAGTLTITPNPDCKDFNIKLFYVPAGVHICKRTPYSADFQWLITEFDVATGEGTIDKSQPSQIFTDRGIGCGEECCSPDLKSDYMVGEINNCCYEDTHSFVKQYELDELFCEDSELQIALFKNKCKNEYYLDQEVNASYLNDYCELYCTERVTIDTPHAITAISGRYFTLTTNSAAAEGFQTTSPYVYGVKRCRMKVHYDKWEKDYYEAVENQVKQYNLFQQKEAYKLMYDDAIAASFRTSETIYATCYAKTQKAECSYTISGCDSSIQDCTAKDYVTSTSASMPPYVVEMQYTRYPFTTLALYPRPWYEVQTNKPKKERHAEILLENKPGTYQTSHGDWSAWNDSPTISSVIAKVEEWMEDYDGKEISETRQYSSKCS